MLIISEQCNMRCRYCYEFNKNKNIMKFDKAVEIIDKELEKISSKDSVLIEFFGGEPFLNFSLIKQVTEYMENKYVIGKNMKVSYSAVTNGTLLTDRIKEWLLSKKEKFEVVLSLDGYKEVHDINRKMADGSGSFERIDLDFFKKLNHKNVSMTVSVKSVPYLAESVIWIEKNGFICQAEFAIGDVWNDESIKILNRELDILVDHYSSDEFSETIPCLFLRKRIDMIFNPYNSNFRPCGICRESLCYDVNGNIAPCNGMSFVSVGDKAVEFEKLKDGDFILSEENVCKSCRYVRLCKTCYAANYHFTGDFNKQSKEWCIVNKACIKACARLQLRRLKNKNEETTLKAARIIIENIDNEGIKE